MNQSEITALVRTGIREPQPKYVSDADITAMTLEGVTALGLEIKECDPSFFRKRAILSSNTFEFTLPSDCQSVEKVSDTLTSAIAITGATNADPVVITAASHGLSDDDIVFISSVGGNTNANGTFKIDNSDDDTFELVDVSGNAAYTSGGYVLKVSRSFRDIKRKNSMHVSHSDRYGWFPADEKIVVDYLDFTNDLLIYYLAFPSAITDIPAPYHMGLVSFCVINLIRIPSQDDKKYVDFAGSAQYHRTFYDLIVSQINKTLRQSSEPKEIYDEMNWQII